MNLLELSQLSEDEVRDYLEKQRWPKGPVCAHCQSANVYRMAGKATRPGLLKCRDCRKQFSVTVGTVMERSHIPIQKWVLAIHLMASSKKGVSAHQVHRMLKVTYKSAWFMCHRIRHAMKEEPMAAILSGTVEVDESYFGGKFHNMHGKARKKYAARGGWGDKIPVVALVERDGRARSRVVANTGGHTLRKVVKDHVDRKARIMTDQHPGYSGLGKHFRGGHESVNHSHGEYVRGDATTNSVEAYFALLKRGVMGTFHHVSREHLDNYLAEFSSRWNTRKLSDEQRRDLLIKGIGGKRLMYRDPVKKNR